jgi:putative Mn2+ efflux pump MntP
VLDVIILAVALSMDAFAVSIGLGSKHVKQTKSLALMSGIYFGLFQGLMPLIGYMGGKGVLGWVEEYAQWVAFALLILIGGKMIYGSIAEGIEDDIVKITHKVMLILAIATSVDAMAAGFTLTFIEINPLLACAIIGAATLFFSWIGVFIGAKSGTLLESKAELLGGIVLILIGFKVLLF